MSDDGVSRFIALFKGFTGAYGRTEETGKRNDRGKLDAKSWTEHQDLTRDKWEDHLRGVAALGVVPLMENNTLKWGVIDVDQYQSFNFLDLEQRIEALKLPLVVCRSKSGGAHIFLFLKDPLPAALVTEKLKEWAAALGYSKSEIFPKQLNRAAPDDIGNWLNIPYYKGNETERYCVHEDKPLSIGAFLDFAESRLCDEATLLQSALIKNETAALFLEGPPCLITLYQNGGFPEGTRNEGMFAIATYLKKRHGEGWSDYIEEYNQAMCVPPLGPTEMATITKSIGRKDYDFRCQQQPIINFCDRKKCQSCKFGVGKSPESAGVDMTALSKHEGDPVLWFATINGIRVMLKTEELIEQKLFRKKMADALTMIPGMVPPARWEKSLNDLMKTAEIIEAPMEASMEGQFRLLMRRYANGNAQAQVKEEIVNGTPWHDGGGLVWFKAEGLLRYIQTQGFKPQSNHHVWQWVRGIDGLKNEDPVLGDYWTVPMTKDTPLESRALPDFTTEDF